MTIDVTQLAHRDSVLVQAGLTHYCNICHSAPGFDCTNPIDGGPLPGRVIHLERALQKGHTMTASNEFAPLIYVDLVEDKPQSAGEWGADNPGADPAGYRSYLDRFQPWRLLVKSGDNQEALFRSTESYFNKNDAIHAADLAFGSGSNVYLRQGLGGNRALRMAAK